MPARSGSRRRQRGFIRQRGGSYQVIVYAGPDPLTGKDSYLRESTRDRREAERIRTRLLARVDGQRNASTSVSLGYVLDAWLEVHEAETTTLETYRSYVERTIKPALGDVPAGKLTARMLERFYAELRRCRARCDEQPYVEHRVDGPHECREVRHRRKRQHDCAEVGCKVVECQPHACRPLGASTVRQMHFIMSGALAAAVRWEWIASNPATVAKKPRQIAPQPAPPTAAEAARIAAAAWEEDAEWGMLVWLAMVTGARRGELLALRWTDLDLAGHVLEIRRSYVQGNGQGQEKATKTHQMRRIALDQATVKLLASHRKRYEQLASTAEFEPAADAFLFSYTPDHTRPCDPDGVSHRYTAMYRRLDIATHLHALRHYSATELVSHGVDVRTVAGRLGHGGGGTTTLRVYSAWVAESDKRAADLIASTLGRPNESAGNSADLPIPPPAPHRRSQPLSQ